MQLLARVCVGLAAAGAITNAAAGAPLETYAQPPLVEHVVISSDGTMIAIGINDGSKSSVIVRTVASQGEPILVNTGATHIERLTWQDSQHLLIVSELPVRASGSSSYNSRDIHEFDLTTKKFDVKKPGRTTTRERWDSTDEVGALIWPNYIQSSGKWSIIDNGKVLASGVNPYGPPTLLAKSSAPDTYLMQEPAAVGQIVREFNLKTGKWTDGGQSAVDRDYLVNGQGEVFGIRSRLGDEDRYEFKSAADQAILETLKRSFPNERVSPASWSDDHRKVVVRLAGVRSPPGYVFVDLDTKKASFIADEYNGLRKGDVAEIKPIAYKAADGLDIHGYLTLPTGREARGLPLVVLVQHEPQERDYLDYSWWAQALVSRGYAVLQANYRGSTGYGDDFAKAGLGEFGRKMQTDLSDGVRYLAGQGIVDPKKVCIVGEAYGGYAALAGAAFDRGVYRCAVSVEPIADLTNAFYTASVRPRSANARYWTNVLGVSSLNDKVLADWSPAQHAEQIEGPVLILRGTDATTNGYDQARKMQAALEKAGKPFEVIGLDDVGTDMSKSARLPMLRAIVSFLEKNNPPN